MNIKRKLLKLLERGYIPSVIGPNRTCRRPSPCA